jgi:hypothetical protein
MIKSNLLLVLYLTIFLFGKIVYAQKVSNITFHQEQSTIIVSYYLDTKTPCNVSLFVSTNDGKTWEGPLLKVTGDVGAKITSGSNGITWNVLEEFDELRGDKIKFQIRANGGELETVVIGNQEWAKRNLNVSSYRNGDAIPEVKDLKKWSSLTTGAWCYYDNNPINGSIYGKLYNWYAVNDPRGLAPEGFHIPSVSELTILTDLKNSNGFEGLPGGYRDSDSTFFGVGFNGEWWSSSEYSANYARDRNLFYNSGNAFKNYDNKTNGFSVRCVKD